MMTRNNEYWNKRLSTVYDAHKRSVKIDNLYRKSYARMYKEIEKLYSECGERELTRTELYRYAKFLSFKNKLRDERGIMGAALDAQLEKALTDVYKDAGLAAKERLGKASEWTVINEKMAQSCVERKWAGSHFSTRIWKDTDKLAKRVENGVVDCIVGGKNQNELRKMLRGEFGVSRRQADCLVRTEVAHALNSGQIETYKSEGVKELEFDCEASACGKCLEIARGNPYPIDKLPCVICHPNCRCTWIPVVDLAAAADNIIKRIDNSGESDIIEMGTLNDENSLGVEHADAMKEILETAPQSVQNVWNKYANDLNVVNAHAKGTAYCQGTKGITLDIDDVAKGEWTNCVTGVLEQAKEPYYTAFHEFGHNISALAAKGTTGDNYSDISTLFRSKKYTGTVTNVYGTQTMGYTLNGMMKREGREYVENVLANLKQEAKTNGLSARTVRKQDAWNYIKQEILKEPVLATSDISDMWDGLSKSSCRPHYGHGKAYWNSHEVGVEAFAEMFSATVMNPDSVKQIQRYFPKSYDIFLEILEEIGA